MKTSILSALFAVTAMTLATSASAQCDDSKDREVKVINDTSQTLVALYGSNVGEDTWEEDVLGDRTLPPGGVITVDWDDDTCICTFDLKAEFENGEEAVHERVNICSIDTWHIEE